MSGARVLLAGGTGLVGRRVVENLLARSDITLLSLVRGGDPRPHERSIDFEALADGADVGIDGGFDVGISCLGTTIRKAGSPAAFRRVDHDYVLAVARLAKARGARQFILVTSVGAGGRGLYLSVKGEIEAAVGRLGFDHLDLIRPGLILGPREERRPAEWLAQKVAPLLNPLLLGSSDRYAAIPATKVAATVALQTGDRTLGVHIHHNREMRRT